MVGIKKIIRTLLLSAVLLFTEKVTSQEISPYFFGQNSWMPDSTGNRELKGKVHQTWPLVKQSGAQSIRFGGIAPDREKPSEYQYLRMIDSIRNNGMEPIIQVSYWGGQYTAQQAGEFVELINVKHKKNIKFWSIGNEPDHSTTYGYSRADQVAPYLKSFSRAMKAADPAIKIIGPDCAWYNKNIIPGLVTPGGPNDVTGKSPEGHFYIDVISFHEYPFSGTQDRSGVISNLTSPDKFGDKLKDLKTKIESCNNHHGRSGENILKMAITEANINFRNHPQDNVNGNGATSFIGGQFWAEMAGIGMKHGLEFLNFWSVVEGNNQALNIGYLDRTTLNPHPSYYHFKMMADNFRGFVAETKSNQREVKTFASKNGNQVVVMILNQSSSVDHGVNIKLDNAESSREEPLKINVDAGINKEYQDWVGNQSSLLLVFDAKGNIIKRCRYGLYNQASKGLPPECESFNAPPTAEITSTDSVICKEGSIILNASEIEGAVYQWNKNNETIEGENTSNIIVNTEGSYTVTVTKNELSATSEPYVVTESEAIEANITPEGSLDICKTLAVLLKTAENPEYTYTWKLNGVDIPASNFPTFEASVPGEYSVHISNSCGESLSPTVKVTSCDGISSESEDEDSLENVLNTYPNPSNGYFTVEMNTDELKEGEVVKLEIFNIKGQLVFSEVPNQLNGNVRQKINMDHNYPSGIYIVLLKTESKSWSNKVIVSK